MIEKNRQVKVINRSGGSVGYEIPDLGNLYRRFEDGEVKILSFEELEKLSYLPGGPYILKNCLVIEDPEVVEYLISDVQPEYFYNKDKVKEVMIKGTLNEFLDMLDFAPQGVKEIIKDEAVKIPLNDVAKREAILNKLNFDVTKAIEILKDAEAGSVQENTRSSNRRAAAPAMPTKAASMKTVRRVVEK